MSTKPEYHEYEEFQNRSRKLEELRALGIEPFPHRFDPTHTVDGLLQDIGDAPLGDSAAGEAGSTQEVEIAGRLVLFRAMGKNAFGHLSGDSERIQVMFNRDHTQLSDYKVEDEQSPKPIKIIEKKLDLGDIVGVRGHLFRTGKGEVTIYAKEVTLLSKSLLPLPDKHAGLHDKELRYRKRWLDLISNPDVRQTFALRSKILQFTRRYLENQDFLEVETPVLQSQYGGAEARPFETQLNALDQHMYLRISLELPLKKLLIGGAERVFELGKVFRNEGIDRNHNPEFTLLEAYAAYWDYKDMMCLVENLYEKLALELFGTTELPVHLPGQEEPTLIDVKAPWRRLTMKESLHEYANIDVDSLSDDALKERLIGKDDEDALKVNSLSRGLLIAKLFEAEVEHKLIQPHHITDHPEETTPLCKQHRCIEERDQGLIERFESFILGGEACNAYSELNDPERQRLLLEKQVENRLKGDEEAHPMDEEFLEAMCQGMPPAAGVGIGMDRLIMLFTDSASIRDVLYFPWMKPSG